eukprot:sb/3469455/
MDSHLNNHFTATQVQCIIYPRFKALGRVLSNSQNTPAAGEANKENESAADLRERLTKVQAQLLEKNKQVDELQEELSDIVRNKSLQFDSLMTNKEKECEEIQQVLDRERELWAGKAKRIEELEAQLAKMEENNSTGSKFFISTYCGESEFCSLAEFVTRQGNVISLEYCTNENTRIHETNVVKQLFSLIKHSCFHLYPFLATNDNHCLSGVLHHPPMQLYDKRNFLTGK